MARTFAHRRFGCTAVLWMLLALLPQCSVAAWGQTVPASPVGLQSNVRFDQYAPLAANDVLASRLLSPLAAARLRRKLSASNMTLQGQPVDLGAERFTLYVPPKAPPKGYGLMVFVPPWPDARIPSGWRRALDAYGLIFVTAGQSGNEAAVASRRIPLALLEAQNVRARYLVDPERVYVAGFSGGSRVAEQIAVAFPDVFAGAVLDAGSDPLGGAGAPVPAKTLLESLQEHSRIVAVTGAEDDMNLSKDAETAQSMTHWCAFNVSMRTAPWIGHDVIGPEALSQALAGLEARPSPNLVRLNACRASLENELAAGLQRAGAEVAAGRLGAARKLIFGLDERFGGFADDRLVSLAATCRCMEPEPEKDRELAQ